MILPVHEYKLTVMNSHETQKSSVLLLHGWGSSHKSWVKVKGILAKKGIEVIIPDMPGFGDCPAPEKPWNGKNYENWVLNYIEENNLTKPLILMGHSFGGGLAMKLAMEHPKLIKKMVLIAAARLYIKKSLVKKFISEAAKVGKKFDFLPFYELLRKAAYHFVVGSKDYTRATGTMKETFVNVIKEDLTPRLHEIKTPTLIIWGDKDVATPVEHAHLLKERIKDSELEIIKGCGHPLNLQCPEKLADIIYKFIK